MKLPNFKKAACISGLLALVLTGLIVLSIGLTAVSFKAVSQQQFSQAARCARTAQPGAALLSIITFNQVPDFEAWQTGLKIIIKFNQLRNSFPDQEHLGIYTSFNQILNNPQALESLKELGRLGQDFSSQLERSWILNKSLPQSQLTTVRQAAQCLDSLPAAIDWLQSDQQLVFLLQNNHELRASGGFIGSLAAVDIKRQQLQPMRFYDVYDLSGQAANLLPAPYGVRKYLSAGEGMNLQDANWHPDFPTAAQDILQLLEQADLAPTMLAAVNLELVEKMLKITGPIYVPDYQTELTTENFSQIAHQDRNQFFSGDKQKKHFLSAAFTSLSITLEQLSCEQRLKLAKLTAEALTNQQVLLYADNPRLQTKFEQNNWAGQLKEPAAQNFVYLVESNVGINKANQNIDRKIMLEPGQARTDVIITLSNHNPPVDSQTQQQITNNPDWLAADHLGYVNYQRVITSPEITASQVSCSGQNTVIEDRRQITSSTQHTFNQAGFLMVVREGEQVTCRLKLIPANNTAFPYQHWELKLQPGVKADHKI